MEPFFSPEFISNLWLSEIVLALMAFGLVFYGCLAANTLFEGKGRVLTPNFDVLDIVIVGGLAALFSVVIVGGFSSGAHQGITRLPSNSEMVSAVLIFTSFQLAIIGGILYSMVARNFSLRETFGLNRAGFAETVFKAVLLLLMAYPLILGAMNFTRFLLKIAGFGEEAPQEIVRFLSTPGPGPAQVIVAISAVIFAPIQEEFIFRGYIYGVVRRYAGPAVGTLFNALLFAGIHLHAPSFGGLFVLAVCLTLAYEWTGSIFVPMAMHALFNSLTVVSLFGGGGDNL